AMAIATSTPATCARLPPAQYRPRAPSRTTAPSRAQRRAMPGEWPGPPRANQAATPSAGRPVMATIRGTSASIAAPSVQRAGVDDGLGAAVAAQHHQQVADHLRLAFLVQP